MKKVLLGILMIALIPSLSFALKVKVGDKLPSVTVKGDDDHGMMQLKGESISFTDWKSSSATGKARTIYLLHATGGAKEVNEEYVTALKNEKFSADSYQTVTILNMDEAVWGTGGIVRGKVKDSQKEFPMSGFVLDENGAAQSKFGADEESAVIVIDKNGVVQFAKDGKLSASDIKKAISALKAAGASM